MKLVATKPFNYATKPLLPGDVFDAVSDRDGKVLIAAKKAERYRDPASLPAPDPALVDKATQSVKSPEADKEPDIPNTDDKLPDQNGETGDSAGSNGDTGEAKGDASGDELHKLRAEYKAKLGKPPFHAWDAEMLRLKIAAAAASNG